MNKPYYFIVNAAAAQLRLVTDTELEEIINEPIVRLVILDTLVISEDELNQFERLPDFHRPNQYEEWKYSC